MGSLTWPSFETIGPSFNVCHNHFSFFVDPGHVTAVLHPRILSWARGTCITFPAIFSYKDLEIYISM